MSTAFAVVFSLFLVAMVALAVIVVHWARGVDRKRKAERAASVRIAGRRS